MARRRGQRTGYLFKKSGTWFLQYRVDTADLDESGKMIRQRLTVAIAKASGPEAIGKREAQRIAWADYLSKVDQSAIRPGSIRTLTQFVTERFSLDYLPTLKPTGRAFYNNMLNNHILPTLGPLSLREIDVVRVQMLLNAKRKQIDPKTKKPLSTQTVLHIRNCLSAVLREAKRMQWFSGDLPTESVRLPEMRRKERRALTWTQCCALSNALTEPMSTLVPFLALTGLRIGEAMGLRWKYVNLTSEHRIVDSELIPPMCIAVRENYVRGRYQSLKSLKSSRNVPIPDWFAPRLTLLQSRSSWIGSNDPVFSASSGKPFDQHNCAKRFLKPAAEALGIGWASWHCLRHANATIADQAGFSVTERQRILGHSDASMTLHYSHADLEQMRERLGKMVDKKLLN